MIKKFAPSLLLTLVLLSAAISPAIGQTYIFSVDQANVDAYYNSDGTLELDYVYVFNNSASADPIDYVDIGLPNGNFSVGNITAEVDGKPITDISVADPQNLAAGGTGFTLALHGDSINPGSTGTVTARITGITGVFYAYNKGDVKDYASVRFSPNFFGSSFVTGSTNMRVSLHLPEGVTPDEPQYEENNSGWPGSPVPQAELDQAGRVTYTWSYPNASSSSRYEFAAAFPAKYIPSDALSVGVSFDPSILICLCIGLGGLGIFGLIIYASVVAAKKRKLDYLPPRIAIEGHGIKRGLTAVEAAILMEQPMDKVLTMILFGLIKKDAVSVSSREPLELKIASPVPAGLQPYETEFIEGYQLPAGRQRQAGLQEVMVTLVKEIAEKMKGFSRKETIAFYEDINKRAWEQVTAAETPEVKSQKFDENLEWTMLDKDYQGRTHDVFSTGPVFLPRWWGSFDPTYHTASPISAHSTPSMGSQSSGPVTINMPKLPGSDFAASMVSGVQSFAGNVVGDVTAFTSGITNKTNPPPPPSTYRSSGGGGGGHSCACACACAGCACACAGGGR